MIAIYVEQERILPLKEKPCLRFMIDNLHMSPLTLNYAEFFSC